MPPRIAVVPEGTHRMTDGELVCEARGGSAAAYGQLARRHAVRVLAACHARAGRSAAEDLAQEVLLRGLRALPTLADPDKFGPWLLGIAARTCLDWLKSAKRSEVSLDALGGSRDGTAAGGDAFLASADEDPCGAAGDRREQAERLTTEVDRLPPVYREVVLLYYHQDCTYQQLADLLGVSPATINARLTRARAMLRARLMAAQE
ncbi:MAG: sigW 3 [Phycisphaerales bacterium]|nr:sigW 3 [Phycisphaerales bacterium]